MNQFRAILVPTLLLSILVYFLHTIALENYFYWIYWWFDILLHTLTGFVLGLLIVFILYRLFHSISSRSVLFLTIAGVLIVAIVWEIFEYVNGFALTHGSYILDTIGDILFGLIGAYIAIKYSSKFKDK